MKRANEIACDRIKTNQILFLPMLAKKLTLEEAAEYEDLDEERLH